MNDLLQELLALIFSVGGLRDFVDLGGPVLLLVILTGFFMWLLIIERVLYLVFGLPRDLATFEQRWLARREYHSWTARQIRHGLIAELEMRATRSLDLIKTLLALASLMGLLGTVTGMLEVFDVIALTGSSNVRAMAIGISRATIPTMAGMVTALIGIYLNALLTGWAGRAVRQFRHEILVLEGGGYAAA
ncbi:MAG: MotA/TolQ/ExbB proton channel family protein [Gammaproteobacteria bacterium]|nr:MotA/TolQ/ExbB proton channel family protein [Gammaproteobacteria bacterium]MBU1653704.1 MotA/TolQ/ExbB proton channel family protein [Gammaproteobacteria bacterium]MBU1962757.1 MotA/TolQ/ExbB proton channel family protein [Gammaproteobacteria bacterium]